MIDIAWSEFLLIALLALILIGPKELPSVLRSIGRWVGKARAFARDISAQLDLDAHIDAQDEDRDNQSREVLAKKEPTSIQPLKDPKPKTQSHDTRNFF